MCLTVPVKILELKKNNKAIADIFGKKQEVDIQLVKNTKVGDYGIISNGFIIKKISTKEAEEILKIISPSSRGAGR
jgi:hydrogenase expression/formation protein HypC